MSLFSLHILLTLLWCAVTGSFDLLNVIFGFALSAGLIAMMRGQIGSAWYFRSFWKILVLGVFFVKELALSAWRVARVALARDMKLKPGFIAFDLKVETDFEIALLANLITLTPGTLSVDVSDDRRRLFIHALDCSDPEGIKMDIASGFERRIIEAFR